MSRSRKKSNFHGITTAVSEKKDKQAYHRGRRKGERSKLSTISLDSCGYEDVQFEKEVKDGGWLFNKDGKKMFDENTHPELKRK